MLGFRKILIANKFMDKKGGVSRFLSKFFVSQCRKSSKGNTLDCHCFRVSKKFMLKWVKLRYLSKFPMSHIAKKNRRATL